MLGTGTPRKSQSGAQPSPTAKTSNRSAGTVGADLGKLTVERRYRCVPVAHLGVDASADHHLLHRVQRLGHAVGTGRVG